MCSAYPVWSRIGSFQVHPTQASARPTVDRTGHGDVAQHDIENGSRRRQAVQRGICACRPRAHEPGAGECDAGVRAMGTPPFRRRRCEGGASPCAYRPRGHSECRKCTGALGQFLANTDSLSRLSGSSTKSRLPTSWSRCVQKLPAMSISLLHALADVQLPMTIEGECVDEVLILAMAGHLVAEVAAPVRTPMGWRNPSANVRAITHLGWRMLRVSSSPSRWKSIPTRSRRCGPKAIGIGTGTLVAAAASVEFLQRALASTP